MDEDFVDISSELEISVGASHHDDGILTLGVSRIDALRGDVAADRGLDRENHAISRRLELILRKQGIGGLVLLDERDVLLFLILDVVDPGAGLCQLVLLFGDFEVRLARSSEC